MKKKLFVFGMALLLGFIMPLSMSAQDSNSSVEQRQEARWTVTIYYRANVARPNPNAREVYRNIYAYDSSEAENKARGYFTAQYPDYTITRVSVERN